MGSLGELVGTPGATAELAENPLCLELHVCPFPGCAELSVGAVGPFLGFELVLPSVRVWTCSCRQSRPRL
jgi:hypothetical protein